MPEAEPAQDFQSLLRLTLETQQLHARATGDVANEVEGLRNEITLLRGAVDAHARTEVEWATTIKRVADWQGRQEQATIDAAAGAKTGVISKLGKQLGTWMENPTIRTVVGGALTTAFLAIFGYFTGIKIQLPDHSTPAAESAPVSSEEDEVPALTAPKPVKE